MENLGACVDVVSCPTFALGLPAYYILALAEASSNLARYDAVRYGVPDTSRTDGFGKYFPFNTFRRLTAHTRLTLSFLSLGPHSRHAGHAPGFEDAKHLFGTRYGRRVVSCPVWSAVRKSLPLQYVQHSTTLFAHCTYRPTRDSRPPNLFRFQPQAEW